MDDLKIFNKILYLCQALQDELSRDIFFARLQCDVEETDRCEARLDVLSGACSQKNINELQICKSDYFHPDSGKKVVIYSIGGLGLNLAAHIHRNGGDFFGFCDKKFADVGGGGTHYFCGKPALPPSWLLENSEDCYVVIASITYYKEILNYLLTNDFPLNHILKSCFEEYSKILKSPQSRQYFLFPELYKKGTAFVDAGCLDMTTSIEFSKWCGGSYSKILAFEPNRSAYLDCIKRTAMEKLPNVELFNIGLGNRTETVQFSSSSNGSSHITGEGCRIKSSLEECRIETAYETVQIAKLDEFTCTEKVGFIKMDIEGMELDALAGSERTILRDKPLLAISVYHRAGDVLAIMDYLRCLVPEYRFWLRHYAPFGTETVLYAAV